MFERLSEFLSCWRWLFGIPCALACAVAAADAILNYQPLPSAYYNFDAAALSALFGAVRFFARYIVFAPFLVLLPYLIWRMDPVPTSLATGLLSWGLSGDLVDLTNLGSILRSLLPLLIAMVGAAALATKARHVLTYALRALVLVSAGLWIYYWLIYFGWRDWVRASPWVGVGTWAVLLLPAFALIVFARLRPAIKVVLAMGFLAFALQSARIPYSSEYRILASDPAPAFSGKIRHVILVVVDTLRSDALHFMNQEAQATPHIDRLAEEAVVFENAISPAPWTYPAMNSLMTGVAPYVDNQDWPYQTAPLPTLASLLSDAGYATRGISGNFILYRPYEVTKGFQEMDTYSGDPLGLSMGGKGLQARFPERFSHGGSTRQLTDEAVRWVRANSGRPFFLWLHYLDPHDPYLPPMEYLSRPPDKSLVHYRTERGMWSARERAEIRSLYQAEVRYVDDNLNRFFEALKELGLYEDALIVFTSDHGEEFWDHGNLGHGHTMYQELLHVPLLMKLPGSGSRHTVSSYVPTLTLTPTVLELCGLPKPEVPGWPQPVTRLLADPSGTPYGDPIISSGTHTGEFQRAVTLDGMKYIVGLHSGNEELYDLTRDSSETHSVVEEHPDVVERARGIIAEHERIAASLRESADIGPGEDPAEALRRLKALGYVH